MIQVWKNKSDHFYFMFNCTYHRALFCWFSDLKDLSIRQDNYIIRVKTSFRFGWLKVGLKNWNAHFTGVSSVCRLFEFCGRILLCTLKPLILLHFWFHYSSFFSSSAVFLQINKLKSKLTFNLQKAAVYMMLSYHIVDYIQDLPF